MRGQGSRRDVDIVNMGPEVKVKFVTACRKMQSLSRDMGLCRLGRIQFNVGRRE